MAARYWTKGTKIRASDGRAYIRCRDGSLTTYARGVLAAELGRELRPDEQVHHLNGDCTDDRPENLSAVGAAEHQRLHGHSWRTSRWSDRTCKGCGCDHDLLTEDCDYCRKRMWARLYREARRAA